MAVFKVMAGFRRLAPGMAALAVFCILAVAPCQGQQPTRQLRARTALNLAIKAYNQGDYETAAKYYAMALAQQKDLTEDERRSLAPQINSNNVALGKQREGHVLLIQAEKAFDEKRLAEAANMISALEVNQYLTPADQQKRDALKQRLNVAAPLPRNYHLLLKMARDALNRGDYLEARRLASEAKKVMPILHPWWGDNPNKILREADRLEARQKSNVPPPKKESSSFLRPMKNLFRKNNPVPPEQVPLDQVPPGPMDPATGPANGPRPEPPPIIKDVPPDKTGSNTSSPFQAVKNILPWPHSGGAKETPREGPNPPPQAEGTQAKSHSVFQSVKSIFTWPGSSTRETAPAQGKAETGPNPPLSRNDSGPQPGTDKVVGPESTDGNNTQLALQLIQQGYQALNANDFKTARQLAEQARELHAELGWWQQTPERLLADIQRRAPLEVIAASAQAPENGKAGAAKAEKDRADARNLLQQGRALFKQNKLEEAEKLCAQAGAIHDAHWGLFEDSPEKLRLDIQKARSRRDREESARLLVEARKLFAQGQYNEAKLKAWRAQQLHGPYSLWDLGDRPQKLLAEIERAEVNQRKPLEEKAPENPQPENKAPGQNPDPITRVGPPPGPAAVPQSPNARSKRPLPAQAPPPGNDARSRAAAMVAQARDLQRKGKLVDALQIAGAAYQLGAAFAPNEDSPDIILKDLGWLCRREVENLVQRAGNWLADNVNDPARFHKAQADLEAAHALATAFRQDLNPIEQKMAWLRQVQGAPPPAIALKQPAPQGNPLGRDFLDKARRELKAGNMWLARRLAEEAFEAKYGVQQEAAALLRSIDAEENDQIVLASYRNAQTGLEAFQRGDFQLARTILAGVNPRVLPPDMARFLQEVMSNPAMQPGGIMTASAQKVVPGNLASLPGKAKASDPAGPAIASPIDEFRAMESVVAQKFRNESIKIQQEATARAQAGDTLQAIELLKDFLDQLARSQLDPEQVTPMRRQVEKRMEQYRTLQAQKMLEKAKDTIASGQHSETRYQQKILKTQDQVVDLMKEYRNFMREGKYKEARLAALKAKELDPDNVAADAAIRIATIEERQKEHDRIRDQHEFFFWKELEDEERPWVDNMNPVAFDKKRNDIVRKRDQLGKGIPATMHNPIERAIKSKLLRPVPPLNFKDIPLKQVMRDLQTLTGVNIVEDSAALQEAGVSMDLPLSLMVEGISLKSALDLLLRQVHLTYVIKHEVLYITTENNARGQLERRTYPVADLVVPVEPEQPSDVYRLDKMLEKMLNNNSGFPQQQGLTPFPGPLGLPNGQTVSSQNSGAAALPNPLTQPAGRRGQTLEETLINLITNSVAPDSWSGLGGPGTILYYPLGMSLVVNQTQDVQEQVQDLLAALRRLQDLEVAIEMKLVSVSESFFEKIGVSFDMNILLHHDPSVQNQLLNSTFQTNQTGVINQFAPSRFISGLTPAGTFTPDLNFPIKASSFGFSNPPFGAFPGALGADGGLSLGLAFLSDIQVFMFMEAAQGDQRMNLMQAPKITVYNGQTAFISVGAFQFFLLGVTVNQSPFGNIFFSPQQIPLPLNVTMRVTPVVSADRRFVRLNLFPSMTNLTNATVPMIPVQIPVPTTVLGPGAGTTTGPPESLLQLFFQQPMPQQIFMSTTVNVPDGGTVLLGGLKTLNEGRNEFGPPILSKIPYISRLFKNVGYGRDSQSLMIMVTPRIIINEEEEQIYIGAIPPIPRP